MARLRAALAVAAVAAVGGLLPASGGSTPVQQPLLFERPFVAAVPPIRASIAADTRARAAKTKKARTTQINAALRSLRRAHTLVEGELARRVPGSDTVAGILEEAIRADEAALKRKTLVATRRDLARAIAQKKKAIARMPRKTAFACSVMSGDASPSPSQPNDFVSVYNCTREVAEVVITARAPITSFTSWQIFGRAGGHTGECARVSNATIGCALAPNALPAGEHNFLVVVGGLPAGTGVEVLLVAGPHWEPVALTVRPG